MGYRTQHPSSAMDSHDYINGQGQGFSSPALSAYRCDHDFIAPSPNLPPIPSYHNPPYATYSSNLEFDGNIIAERDYDPAEFEPPSNNAQVSATPPAMDAGFNHAFDHSYPATSNGFQDRDSESRVWASSISSHSHPSYPATSNGFEEQKSESRARTSFTSSHSHSHYDHSFSPVPTFEPHRFDSRHWNTVLLPADKPSSPSQKPPSRPPIREIASLDPPSSNNRNGVNLNRVHPSTSPQPQGHTSFPTDLYQSGYSNPSSHPGFGRISGPRHSRSEGGISYPPPAHSDFIARTAASNLTSAGQQFLSPPSNVVPIRGHHRRSSSGSRERGIGGMGLHNAPGSGRASPYPSPRASPSLSYDPLPSIPSIQSLPPPSGMGRGRPVSMPAYGASSYGIPPGGIGELDQQLNHGGNLSDMGPPLSGKPTTNVVSKPNVTTTATAVASERRRKTDANFACHVPGCGSTFTRRFNLMGALRRYLRQLALTCRFRSHAFT